MKFAQRVFVYLSCVLSILMQIVGSRHRRNDGAVVIPAKAGISSPLSHKPYNVIFLSICFVLILLRCQNPFAPAVAGDDVGGALLLTEQKNPDEVLQNFQYAYTFKDSLVYSEVLDSAFIFVSTNFNVSPPEAIVWGRDQELKTTGRMFRFFNTLDLVWGSRPLPDPPANSETFSRKITFTLTLDGGSAIPTLIGEVTFTFIKRGERWYISRWQDEVPG